MSGGVSAAGVLAVAAAGAVALAGDRQQQQETALCAAPAFKYTGEPGTAHERSFIVSDVHRIYLLCTGCWNKFRVCVRLRAVRGIARRDAAATAACTAV